MLILCTKDFRLPTEQHLLGALQKLFEGRLCAGKLRLRSFSAFTRQVVDHLRGLAVHESLRRHEVRLTDVASIQVTTFRVKPTPSEHLCDLRLDQPVQLRPGRSSLLLLRFRHWDHGGLLADLLGGQSQGTQILEGFPRTWVLLPQRQDLCRDWPLPSDLDLVDGTLSRSGTDFAGHRRLDVVGRDQAIEVGLVRFTEGLEVIPPPVDVRSSVEDDHGPIDERVRLIFVDDPHHAADELDERAQVGEDAEDRSDRQEWVIEAFTQLANLNDDIQLVAFELLMHLSIRGAVLLRVYVVGSPRTCPIRLTDLQAVLIVQRRGDYLETPLARFAPEPLQLPDRAVNDRCERCLRRDDAPSKTCILFSEATNLVEPHLDLRVAFSADIAQRLGVQNHCAKPLHEAKLHRSRNGE